MKPLLLLSNGAGEDAIAAKILGQLPERYRQSVYCCPLVGAGRALEPAFPLIGPRVLPPSEGLFRESWRLALQDLLQGVLAGHLRQLAFLRRQRGRFGLILAVGDLFPVLWGGLAGLGPIVFVGTAKSVYHHPYSAPERFILGRLSRQVIVRDQATAEELTRHGLPACWLGNAMMDEVVPADSPLPLATGIPLVTVLPGSRKEAPKVLPFQLDCLLALKDRVGGLQAAVAAAPGGDPHELAAHCAERGWRLQPCSAEGALGQLERDGWTVPILQGRLGDLLAASRVALGQAGTANEQAAGAGVPVVAYDARVERGLRWYRWRQTGLLGEAVKVVAPSQEAVVGELERLVVDGQEHARRAAIGRERMGPPGGSLRMANSIVDLWSR